jgi:hypothetical protein
MRNNPAAIVAIGKSGFAGSRCIQGMMPDSDDSRCLRPIVAVNPASGGLLHRANIHTPLDEFHPTRFRCHMGVNFTIRELRDLEQFCLEQADESGTPDGRAALRLLAENYAAAAASLAATGRRCSTSAQ